MCVAMNEDHLNPGTAVPPAPTETLKAARRLGARTHLMSPAMVAAAAVNGVLTDLRTLPCPLKHHA
jgi:3-isopropylmalate/(R)-2-methylmalate dehydratase large subunit